MTWQTLKVHSDYEMSTIYPHVIRDDDEILLEEQYVEEFKTFVVNIDGQIYSKAHLVAMEFLENQGDSKEIKFLNRNKCDYRISNLQWVTKPSAKTPLKAVYLDKLPEGAVKIKSFNDIKFNDYFFDPESKNVIQINASKSKDKIKLIKPSTSNKRNIIVIKDSDGDRRTIDYCKLVEFYSKLDS
jgi:hypothetical protein